MRNHITLLLTSEELKLLLKMVEQEKDFLELYPGGWPDDAEYSQVLALLHKLHAAQ